jgi:glycosyltransferase involved in cell wall biosynthesis
VVDRAQAPRRRVLEVIRPAVGGMKGQMLQVARGLRAAGWDVEVACPSPSDVADAATADGLRVTPIDLVGPLHPVKDPACVIALARVIRDGRFDIVHAHGFKAGLVARLAARRAGRVPAIVTVHNHVLYRDIAPFTKWRYVTVERWLARGGRTARLITVSDTLREELVGEYGIDPELITTVHNGLDLAPLLADRDRAGARERYGLPRDALVFGIAARFASQKAMDVLVATAPALLGTHPEACYLLAGDGPLLDQAEEAARATGFAERILFPGFERDVPGLLAALDVYVSSALSEGLPLATIEAMAAGLPVASTRAGGTPEVVADGITGLLAEPGDAHGLADAMLRLADDAALRQRFGAAGRERAIAEFTEERMIERTLAVFEEVLCSSSNR